MSGYKIRIETGWQVWEAPAPVAKAFIMDGSSGVVAATDGWVRLPWYRAIPIRVKSKITDPAPR